jgi:hypothetical protein
MMMDYKAQLKLQAMLDGELPEAEARQVANGVARDREALALQTELRQTRQALAGHETGVTLPESREFYWSKIKKQIERLEPATAEPIRVPLHARLSRYLWPAGALAVLIFGAALFVSQRTGAFPAAELATADTGAFTYRDYSAGATLIWLSYPAEEKLAKEPSRDTLNL